jgi:hypothetical protein
MPTMPRLDKKYKKPYFRHCEDTAVHYSNCYILPWSQNATVFQYQGLQNATVHELIKSKLQIGD